MRLNESIKKIQHMEGNYSKIDNNIFISPDNIKRIFSLVEDVQDVLLTPFLINAEEELVYELHYYEFMLEVSEGGRSHYIEYPTQNILPPEIIENIKPKAIISPCDKEFFHYALNDYFYAMDKMNFEAEKKAIPALNDSKLYYQIY